MLGLALVGCGPADPPPPPPPEPVATAETGAPPAPTADTAAPPALLEAAIRQDSPAGLTAWLDVAFAEPVALEVTLEAGPRLRTWRAPTSAAHEVLLTGLLAGGDTRVVITGVAEDGRRTEAIELVATEEPLPEDLDPPEVTVHDAARVEPGATLLAHHGYVHLLDVDGEVLWYLPVGEVHEAHFRDGHLWVAGGKDHVGEWDLAGRPLRRLATPTATPEPGQIDLPLLATHHEVQHLPSGNLLVLDVERRLQRYPTSELDPAAPLAPAWVAGDVPTELTPDGAVVATWPAFELLDPERIGRSSITSDFWWTFAPWAGDDTRDWSHGNALSYDPATDTLLASFRNQDAVVAFSRATGELRWILAPPANWREPWASAVLAPATPASTPFYHQHAARFTPSGTVMLFDNGNFQASAYEPPTQEPVRSRALEIRPDPDAGTYEVVWSWTSDVFCPSMGDADPLPVTGNVLVTLSPGVGLPSIREVARDGTVVWEARMTFLGSWYRSARVAGLFPWEASVPAGW